MSLIQTIGTAGHIDHGKTTLVRALTGIDTDRLPEEKKRGISIELGFAHFTTPAGRRIGIVDVPGHEKFIKNMVAGAWGIRAYLLVIAADEGIMPQTREHRDILELLGVTQGVIALTKADLADAETRAGVRADVGKWLAGTPFEGARIVETAASDPDSVSRLTTALDELLATLPDPVTSGLFRLPVDRVFTLKGHGTVVTGTVASGKLSAGAAIEILPGQSTSRVRSLEAFDQPVEQVFAGQRAALNLPDVTHEQIARGDLCVEPGYFHPSSLLDCRVRLLRGLPRSASPLATGSRIRLYLGTREVLGRIHLLEGKELLEGGSALAQLRLESPVSAARGDHYLLRLYAPMVTIGGGQVLDPCPQKHRKAAPAADRLQKMERATPQELVVHALDRSDTAFYTPQSLSSALALPVDEVLRALEAAAAGTVERAGEHYFSGARIERECRRLVETLDQFHSKHPPAPGIDRIQLHKAAFSVLNEESFDRLLLHALSGGRVEVEQNLVRRAGWRPRAGNKLEAAVARAEKMLAEAPELFLNLRTFETEMRLMRHEFQELVKFLAVSGRAVRVSPDLMLSVANFERLLKKAMGALAGRGKASTPELKDATGLTRKYLIPFLEHLDQTGVTARSGNDRVLRGKR
ncbi:MAG: selenocysteine-specific translation elongation factor [Candidatus Wallbacteria bacterium]|nr:selenocysteine-specific translation elongation factor [Candidatus Wallbacteria bacterium]